MAGDTWRPGGVSIRTKVMALMSVLVVLIMSLQAGLLVQRERERTLTHLRQKAVKMADMLSTTCLVCFLRDDLPLVAELVEAVHKRSTGQGDEDLAYLVVTDNRGVVLHQWGADCLDPRDDKILTDNVFRSPEANRVDRVWTRAGDEVLDAASKMSLVGVDGVTQLHGACRVGLSLGRMHREARRVTLWILAGLLAFVAAGILLAYLFTKQPLDTIDRLSRQIARIAAGDFARRVVVTSRDELGVLSEAVNSMAVALEKREILRQYISKTAWDDIERGRGPGQAASDREEGLQQVTILFTDIRNFTALSESRHTQEIVSLLNEIFSVLVEVIEKHGGVVDKFIGDALLVVFYPEEGGDDAPRAVFCAEEMQTRLAQYNSNRAFYGREAIRIGIGINSGEVITGSIGSERRKDYTVIGDPVNVAARLQEFSKEARHSGIILSESTCRQVRSVAVLEPLEQRAIRGKAELVQCYELVHVLAVDEILRKLRAGPGHERAEAFLTVQALPAETGTEAMVELVGQEDQDLILRAVAVLGRIGRGDARVAEVLTRVISTTTDKRVLATAIKATAHLADYRDFERLEKFLDDEDSRVRANTIEALDQVEDDRYLEKVARLIHDPVGRVKANAAVALWRRGRPEVLEQLESMTRSPEARERAGAAFAAGELFKVSGLGSEGREAGTGTDDPARGLEMALGQFERLGTMLFALLKDPEEQVVTSALRALARARDSRALLPLARVLVIGKPPMRALALEAMERIGAPIRVLRLLAAFRGPWRGKAV